MRALLLENIHPDASARLAKDGYQVETLPRALGEDELIEALRGVSLLGIRSGTQITGRVLDAAPELLAIGAFCIGVNQIDLAAASRHGIAVFNAPFSNTRSVVELAVAQIIAMARRLPEKNAQMHAGVWDKSAAGSHEVRGRTLGIVGYGNIGTQLSVLAEALGMTVYFYDIADKLALGNVILTPHIGGSTEEAQQDIGEFVADKLTEYMTSGATSLSVNLPTIALPVANGTHRLVHLHHNVPGVLASIDRVLAEHGVNVEGQLLRTRDEYGYVLTNIVPEYSKDVVAELRAMPVTIRLRTVHT